MKDNQPEFPRCEGFVWFRMFRPSRWHHWHYDTVVRPIEGCVAGGTTKYYVAECCRCKKRVESKLEDSWL